MEWLVKNALNRDVERQHLNKILQDIKSSMDALASQTASLLSNKGKSTALEAFTLRITGDITGTGNIDGSKTVIIDTRVGNSTDFVNDAPNDGKVYGRKQGSWVIPTTKDVVEKTNLYFTPDRAVQAVQDAIDAGISTGIQFDYDSGTMDVTVTGGNVSDNYPNGEASALPVGTPVCVVGGQLFKATTMSPKNEVIGLVVINDIASGDTGFVKAVGPMILEASEWDAVTGGSGGLTPGADYFVNSSGQLTTTIPTSAGEAVYYVGYAVSVEEFIVRISVRPQRQAYKVPAETPDGVLTTFTTPTKYLPNTLVVTLNGLIEPITELTTTTFSFTYPPVSTDVIYLDYF